MLYVIAVLQSENNSLVFVTALIQKG